MKAIGTVLTAIVLASLGFLVGAAEPITGNRVNNSETILWSGTSTNLTLAQTAQPVTPVSVELTFKTAANNSFNFSYVRGAYTNVVIDRTVSNWVTCIFFLPRDLKLVGSDKLNFTKSRVDQAQLTINWK
jgi:hypothetical protein